MSKLAGGCLCGAVRYELSGRPRLSVSCHCRECQYVSGGGPAHAMVMRAEGVTITNGRTKEHWTISARGSRVARLFCADCGTLLFAKNASHPEFLAVKAGASMIPGSSGRTPISGPNQLNRGTTSTARFRASSRIRGWARRQFSSLPALQSSRSAGL
jgi:hypothetical protein